ncbi:PaaI family thioesterase [Streptomyces sp. NPDC058373]|uniref:PaaI family thioesterase n=1 Tax=Streptomyces sp. NPDC058373 TaxID=3346465 RepID=UPI00365056B6
MRLRDRRELRHQHGFLHGGVLSHLADNALTFAGGLALGGDALTAEYKINYARPAVGDTVIARAEAVVIPTRQAICRCSLYVLQDEVERVALADFLHTYSHRPHTGIDGHPPARHVTNPPGEDHVAPHQSSAPAPAPSTT